MANKQRMMEESRKEIDESLEELLSEFRTPTTETRRESAASGAASGGPSRSARGSSSVAEEIPRHTAFPIADSRLAAAAELFAPRVRRFERPLLSEQARAVDMAILGVTPDDDVVAAPIRGRRRRRRAERGGREGEDYKNDLVEREKEKGAGQEKGKEVRGDDTNGEGVKTQEAKGSTAEVPNAQPQVTHRGAGRPAVGRRAPPGRDYTAQHPRNAPTGPRQAYRPQLVPTGPRQAEYPQYAPTGPRQAHRRPYARLTISQQTLQDQ
ncbi:hypothetical protein MMC15_007948 [Xylographa vitiligo]|nr:hypothetical protein [Xylographa vitiligo]